MNCVIRRGFGLFGRSVAKEAPEALVDAQTSISLNPFLKAATEGDTKAIQSQLKSEIDADTFKAALETASTKGYGQVVKVLLSSRPSLADPPTLGKTLVEAVDKRYGVIVSSIVRGSGQIEQASLEKALERAAITGRFRFIRDILKYQKVQSAIVEDSLQKAANAGYSESVAAILRRTKVSEELLRNVLLKAAERNQKLLVKRLIALTEFPKSVLEEALEIAKQKEAEEVVSLLSAKLNSLQ